MVWIEWTGVPGALGDPANMAASLGGWRVEDCAAIEAVVVQAVYDANSFVRPRWKISGRKRIDLIMKLAGKDVGQDGWVKFDGLLNISRNDGRGSRERKEKEEYRLMYSSLTAVSISKKIRLPFDLSSYIPSLTASGIKAGP